MAYAYNVNPGTQGGSGTFGAVPGQLSLPSPFSDLGNVYPNLSGTNAQISQNIMSGLQGQLSPQTLANLQNYAANFGVRNGMPGSNGQLGTLANNYNLLGNIQTQEQLQQQALQNYNQTMGVMSQTQTVNPALQLETAATNAQSAAMPNPADAASYAKELFDQYLQSMSGPAGGTGFFGGGGSRPPWYNFGQMGGGGGGGGSPYTYFASIPGAGGGQGSAPSWMAGPNPSSYLTAGYSGGAQSPWNFGGGDFSYVD